MPQHVCGAGKALGSKRGWVFTIPEFGRDGVALSDATTIYDKGRERTGWVLRRTDENGQLGN